jgi:hypothetical protein
MDREKLGFLLGIVVLAVGIALLAFTFYSAFTVATNPNGPLKTLSAEVPIRASATLSVSFSFSPNPVTVNMQTQGTISITGGSQPFFVWINGTTPTGCQPSSQPMQITSPTYNFQCTPSQTGTFNPSVDVADRAGDHGSTTYSLTVQSSGSGSPPGSGSGGNVSLVPLARATLTVGMYMVMAVVGAVFVKAGWSMIRPRPETIRIRLKPEALMKAIEPDVPAPPKNEPPGGS